MHKTAWLSGGFSTIVFGDRATHTRSGSANPQTVRRDQESGIPHSMNPVHKEQIGKVRTKIVATLGPASNDPAVLRQMVDAGVDVFRLNFSHGRTPCTRPHSKRSGGLPPRLKHSWQSCKTFAAPRSAWERLWVVSSIATTTPSLCSLKSGEDNDPHCLTSTYSTLADDLDVGQSVLFADGTVAMDVVARGSGWARLKVTLPGHIRSNQGINVPRAGLSVER